MTEERLKKGEVLRLWMSQWQTLTLAQQIRFLGRDELSEIVESPGEAVSAAIQRYQQLDEILTELRRAAEQAPSPSRSDTPESGDTERRTSARSVGSTSAPRKQPKGPAKARFRCGGCGREFVDVVSALVDCRKCKNTSEVRLVCRSCDGVIAGIPKPGLLCGKCSAARDVASRAAGAGETPNGPLGSKQGRARRWGPNS